MQPVLYGVSGIFPLGAGVAWACAAVGTSPAAAAAPTVTPRLCRKSRRLGLWLMVPPPVVCRLRRGKPGSGNGEVSEAPALPGVKARDGSCALRHHRPARAFDEPR